ncbi:CHAT domain-containing protein [Alkalimarinus alittae]|uniref:CHAT domain-containing protein n=1 Tax=Alkalimarinus alittae TaxID=2961619 RepID=A0ABY6MZW1_9ALTE|nr:CHAT domain-containing protein [Alkalimarinus alittae]UZE95312.1 CHAT domain-containing protein [Alkalimarinus alittae]
MIKKIFIPLLWFCQILLIAPPAHAEPPKGQFFFSEKTPQELLRMLEDPTEVAAAKDYEADFLTVCELYLSTNRFQAFFSCIDELSQSQFRYMYGKSGYTEGLQTLYNGSPWDFQANKHDMSFWRFTKPRHKRLKMEAWYRLNDFSQAYKYGSEALAEYIEYSGGLENLKIHAVNFSPRSPWSGDVIVTAGITALSAIQLGNEAEAKRILAILEQLHTKLDLEQAVLEPDEIREAYMRMVQVQLDQADELDYVSESRKTATYLTAGSMITLGLLFQSGDLFDIGADAAMGSEIEDAGKLRIQLQNARLAILKQDSKRAEEEFTKIIDNPELAKMTELHWLSLFERGRFYASQGQLETAEKDLYQSIDVIESTRGNISTESMKIGFTGSKTQVYQTLVDVLVRQKKVEPAFNVAERSRARTMIDMLADEELHNRGTDISSVLTTQTDITSNTNEPAWVSNSGNVQRGLKRKVATVRKTQPQMASLLAVDQNEFNGLQQLINKSETLVEYFKTEDQWYAFVATREDIKVIPLGTIDLAELTQRFRTDISQTNSAQYQQTAQQLYGALWKPIEGLIKSDEVVLVLDESLHYIPMSALHDGQQFLLEKYHSIRQLPSLAVSQYIAKPTSRNDSILILGNPTQDLPGAEQEAQQVANLYGTKKLLLQSMATKSTLLNEASNFRYLHIASHGVYENSAPLDSYLLLAGDNQETQRLTVAELYRAKLNNDLVVLSGCETGLNEVANGNDLLGFTRGFLFAGSRSIVSSLWLVDDSATEQLMTEFHQRLATNNKGQALNASQRKILNQFNAHPYYWAAFQLTGAN